jgi:DNA-binding transcriptional MerR regulator
MAELMSIGGLAAAVHRSPSRLRQLERAGVLPPATRLVGSDRRAYRPEDVETIRRILAERDARRRPDDR